MPSLQVISSRLQQLVESPTSNHRARRSKRAQKSSKSTPSRVPFSPRISFLKPLGSDRDMAPLLSASHSNTPSMLSAVTTTGVYSNPPSIISSPSFAKSETFLPVLSLPSNAESDKSNHIHRPQNIPSVNIHETPSHRPDFLESFRLPVDAADVSAQTKLRIPNPRCDPASPTAYYSLPNPQSASGTGVEKDEHEIYLDSLRLLHFGEEGFLSQGSLLHQNSDDDDESSWEDVNLQKYGWQV